MQSSKVKRLPGAPQERLQQFPTSCVTKNPSEPRVLSDAACWVARLAFMAIVSAQTRNPMSCRRISSL